ncbi:hypothetical protein MuYL_1805 [Mucilaginibacter xinganensis]|uniref:Uncharacterized protein n=1 Tax=Mucilaginibacter xinganensis TaxID=1234841 RepID=A0A223NVY7_9SPHI|nr:hypothetical protein MuYL_1805 [Mucilaginibacter xinganensis]
MECHFNRATTVQKAMPAVGRYKIGLFFSVNSFQINRCVKSNTGCTAALLISRVV